MASAITIPNRTLSKIKNVIPLEQPLLMKGKVIHGYGRGSKLLGIPTANIPTDPYEHELSTMEMGVYIGFAKLNNPSMNSLDSSLDSSSQINSLMNPSMNSSENTKIDKQLEQHTKNNIFKTVIGIGDNPQFQNIKKTIEPHLLHEFDKDFYDANLEIVICGYIRPYFKFNSLEELIETMHKDIFIGKEALDVEPFINAKNLLL
ncbi:hypothetical protein ABK040_007318 [Willaertia magna]